MPDLSLQGKEKPARLRKGKGCYRETIAGTSVGKGLKVVDSQDKSSLKSGIAFSCSPRKHLLPGMCLAHDSHMKSQRSTGVTSMGPGVRLPVLSYETSNDWLHFCELWFFYL